MVQTFPEMIQTLESYGLTDVLLPFLLIFTITYAVLFKSNIMGDSKKPFNKIMAFVMAMAVVIPHVVGSYPPGMDVVEIINMALPNVSLLMVAAIMALLMIGVFGKDVTVAGTGLAGWVVLLSFLAVGFIFAQSAGLFGARLPSWFPAIDAETKSLLVIILVFGALIWFITKDEPDPGKKRKPINETINDMFGGVLKK